MSPRLPVRRLRGAASLAVRLGEARDVALLSRRLATVADDAPADAGLDDLAYAGADRAAVEPLFERLGFGRIRDRIARWAEPGARPPVGP
jgi:DNA polymerase-1